MSGQIDTPIEDMLIEIGWNGSADEEKRAEDDDDS